MKRIKISVFIVFVSLVGYLIFDRELFYYGKNDLNIYNSLPFKIKPEFRYDFEGGFVLRDEYGMSHVGKGVKYWSSDIVVEEILEYGYTEKKLIAKVLDTSKNIYYIEFSSNKNQLSKQELSVNVSSKLLKNDLINKYKWIKIKGNNNIETIEIFRFLCLFVFIIAIILIIFKKK